MQKYTLKDFEKDFPDDAACLEWLKTYLYPNGIFCKQCQRVTKHHRVKSRLSYSCDYCGHHVHPTAGTVYHKSTTPLRLWFYAVYRMASTRCGMPAKQLQRETGVTYKTAWRMAKQIRVMLSEPIQPLSGEVEIDEVYIGGKRRRRPGKSGRGAEGKTPALGLVQRHGRVVVKAVPNLRGDTVMPIIQTAVPSSETIMYTDELSIYERLSWVWHRYPHFTIRHGDRVYAKGPVHTNTIEGFWSLVKRGIHGVYHSVSPKYLQHYLDEYSFRYNHRGDSQPMFQVMLHRVGASGKLS